GKSKVAVMCAGKDSIGEGRKKVGKFLTPGQQHRTTFASYCSWRNRGLQGRPSTSCRVARSLPRSVPRSPARSKQIWSLSTGRQSSTRRRCACRIGRTCRPSRRNGSSRKGRWPRRPGGGPATIGRGSGGRGGETAPRKG